MHYKIFIVLLFLLILLGCSADNTTVEPKDESPTIKISSPIDDNDCFENVKIVISASDSKGIAKVEIYIDGSIEKTLFVPPFEYDFRSSQLEKTFKHSLYAKAYDTDDNLTSSAIVYFNTYKNANPTNLTILDSTTNDISFSWQDNSLFETEFILEMSEDNLVFMPYANIDKDNTSFTLSGNFHSDKIISFKLNAITDNSFSDYSNIVSVKVGSNPKIHNLSMPDSIKVSDQDTELRITLIAEDNEGLGTIDKVYFDVTIPNNTEKNRFLMFDDGRNGDLVKNDGQFTTIRELNNSAELGKYLFTFECIDTTGRKSNNLSHSLLIYE